MFIKILVMCLFIVNLIRYLASGAEFMRGKMTAGKVFDLVFACCELLAIIFIANTIGG